MGLLRVLGLLGVGDMGHRVSGLGRHLGSVFPNKDMSRFMGLGIRAWNWRFCFDPGPWYGPALTVRHSTP